MRAYNITIPTSAVGTSELPRTSSDRIPYYSRFQTETRTYHMLRGRVQNCRILYDGNIVQVPRKYSTGTQEI
jgi:hypothetical protein